MSELTFMLWNATSLHNKTHEFNYFINNNNINVALVTETWLNSQINPHIINYHLVRSDSQRKGGGVAIVINKQIKYYILP